MNASTLSSKYAARFGDAAGTAGGDQPAGSDAEGIENLGAFGLLRGVRDRAEMLELRKKTGNVRAIGYGWVQKVDFDPSGGMTLFVGEETIRIKGRNLNTLASLQLSLLGGILRHRVSWISEADQSTALQAEPNAVVVESIEW